jgi:2'-5' RNA ligase
VNRGPGGPQAPGRRLFVAIPIPQPVRDSVASMVESVRAEGDPSIRDVRWVRLDGLHLTIRFLGPTEEGAVTAISAAVDRVANSLEPFDVVLAGAGAFPSVARPRALWLGVDGGLSKLEESASALEDALADAGWPRSERPFRPHLTLARSDGVRAGPQVARRLIDAAAGVRESFRADALVLFETVSGGGPARYLPLHEARFR